MDLSPSRGPSLSEMNHENHCCLQRFRNLDCRTGPGGDRPRAVWPRAQPAATRLARPGSLRLPPFRREYVHRQGMGLRRRAGDGLQPHRFRRRPDRPHGQGGRPARAGAHLQTSRRLLPLAQQVHRALGQEQPVERRQRRRGPRDLRRLPPVTACSSAPTSRPGTATTRTTAGPSTSPTTAISSAS